MDTTLEELIKEIEAFRNARDWKQFHTLKNLLISLSLEASELLELAQWKSDAELVDYCQSEQGAKSLANECADIFVYLLLITAAIALESIPPLRNIPRGTSLINRCCTDCSNK